MKWVKGTSDRNLAMMESFEGRAMLLGERHIDQATALDELRWLWGRRYPKDKLTKAEVRVEDGQWWGSCEYETKRKKESVSWTKIKLVGCLSAEITNEEAGKYLREGWRGIHPTPVVDSRAVIRQGRVYELSREAKSALAHFFPVLVKSGSFYGGTKWRVVIPIEQTGTEKGLHYRPKQYTASMPSKKQREWIRRYENDR